MTAPDAARPAAIGLHAPAPVVVRLAADLAMRGHTVLGVPAASSRAAGHAPATDARALVFGPGETARSAAHALHAARPGDRILTLGWIGVHRDARCAPLREGWELEEYCRASGLPVLALRLGPLVSRHGPLWRRLAGGPPRGRAARVVLHPALESDVVESIDRALRGHIDWSGWHELGGSEVFDLTELAALARRDGSRDAGEWEPALDALVEQRLIEPELWARWAGFEPASIRAETRRWAA